jgi:predicted PurR-regulated permease PerM
MQGSITLNELGVFIVFALIVAVSGYTVIMLRNINGLIKEVSAMLQNNKDNLNRIIPNMAVVSENTARISEEVKNSLGEAGEAIRTISHDTTDTVLTINETASTLATYALVLGEIVKMIGAMFSPNEKEAR